MQHVHEAVHTHVAPHFTPLIDFSHTSFASIFGDTTKSEFWIQLVPLMYVCVLPFLNMARVLLCSCNPSLVPAASWPPKPEKKIRVSRGRRVVRSVLFVTGAFKSAGQSPVKQVRGKV